jgi:hypothetical protein
MQRRLRLPRQWLRRTTHSTQRQWLSRSKDSLHRADADTRQLCGFVDTVAGCPQGANARERPGAPHVDLAACGVSEQSFLPGRPCSRLWGAAVAIVSVDLNNLPASA